MFKCAKVQDYFPFLETLLNGEGIQIRSVHHRKKKLKIQYLPHHQCSHDEGVEDSEETINRRWVKAREKEKEEDKVTVDRWKNVLNIWLFSVKI